MSTRRLSTLQAHLPALIALLLALGAHPPARAAEPSAPPRPALGINLAGVTYYSSEIPFIDIFKTGKPFVFQKLGERYGVGEKHDLRPDGYPARLLPNHVAETLLMIVDGHYPGGQYVCLYDGKGKIELGFDAKVTSESAGRIVCEVKPKDGIRLRIVETDPNDPIHNIRLMRAEFEKSYKDQVFDPQFLDRWHGMTALRFMDWQRTNNSPLKHWDERAKVEDLTWDTPAGVPVEVMVDLANRLKADPWFCVPHQADDEFVRSFATLVKEKLDPNRKVYVEYSNECWNGIFAQARYCAEQGKALKLSDNAYQAQLRFFSQRSVEVFGIWEGVFGGRDRLVRVLASHAANPWASEQIVVWQGAAKHADALGIAPYFGHELGDPKSADANAALTPEKAIERLRAALPRNREMLFKQAKVARDAGLTLVAYEGGQHLAGHGGAENNDRLTRLLIATNRDPRMKELYLQHLNDWRDAGGGLYVLFSSMGKPSKWGSWGLLEAVDQDPATAPKWLAVRAYLSGMEAR
jgi:hypothetical protein